MDSLQHLMPALDGGDDVLRIDPPDEGLGSLVVLLDKVVDRGLQGDDGMEDAPLQLSATQFVEALQMKVEPGYQTIVEKVLVAFPEAKTTAPQRRFGRLRHAGKGRGCAHAWSPQEGVRRPVLSLASFLSSAINCGNHGFGSIVDGSGIVGLIKILVTDFAEIA